MSPKRNDTLKVKLERDIIAGLLKPGARLDEVSLAERFQVSRTPIREALLQLSSMGLVQLRPRRGAVVAEIGLKELLDMFEVMAELEGMCGRLAARRATKPELDHLQDVHAASEDAVTAGDYDAYYRCNVAFHETIYQASRNLFLAEQTMKLRNRLAPYRRSQLHQNGRLSGSFNEHKAILAALIAQDGAAAERLMQGHLTAQGGSMNDFIASLPDDVLNRSDPAAVAAG
ncbi:MAG: GntR family transcriptional regulator [Rhodospirillales bacterium]|nr:GntR family transcriptional regulator [Rhodospirillales bacterium]